MGYVNQVHFDCVKINNEYFNGEQLCSSSRTFGNVDISVDFAHRRLGAHFRFLPIPHQLSGCLCISRNTFHRVAGMRNPIRPLAS